MKKSVAFTLKPVTVTFDATGKESREELLRLAEKAFIEKLSNQFTSYSYTISNGEALSESEIFAGKVAKIMSTGETVIITGLNRKTIDYVDSKGILMRASANVFSEGDINDVKPISPRTNITMSELGKPGETHHSFNIWDEGKTGYFVNKGEIFFVVIGKIIKGQYLIHILNSRSFYKASYDLMNRKMFATKEEAENSLRKVV